MNEFRKPLPPDFAPPRTVHAVGRREFIAFTGAVSGSFARTSDPLTPIIISVQAMFDQGAHSGKGLSESERSTFKRCQERARREFATSGILFDVRVLEGAYLRTQGYSEIPSKFLARKAINLFITSTLGYDIDRDRTGGCSIGPRAPRPGSAGDPFYKTFLGLSEAGGGTLAHEYAHHFTLDTQRNPTTAGNFWADLRNDYWLWRQRHGTPIAAFRACANSPWAKLYGSS
jgi:hypothetical protein